MIQLYKHGAYLLNGTELVEDTPEAAAILQSKLGTVPTKEEAAQNTMAYGILKGYSFFAGANHLPDVIPKGTGWDLLSGGLILPLNICVGMIVMCTVYGFYALFTKGDI